ncbi:hypothetical protein ACJQWK_05892 [Exserohilum turcicum]
MPIYTHTPSSPALQQALKASLPYSINLVYRIQHVNQTPHAHVLATFPASSMTTTTATDAIIPPCWAAAYLDQSKRPETELWLFSTLELPEHGQASDDDGGGGGGKYCLGCKNAVLDLVGYMATLPAPPMLAENAPAMHLARQHEKEYPTPPPSGAYQMTPGTYMRHLLLPKVVTLGACQRDVFSILREAGIVRTELPGPDAELNKFLFKLSDLPETRPLPDGLRWGQVRKQDIATVQARTAIPRTAGTLMSLKSVAVFEEKTDTPVAWTFLGLDGSLVSLHTEEAYRGKGIAKAVAARLLRQHAQGLAVDNQGNAWSHADVYMGNVQNLDRAGALAGTSAAFAGYHGDK